MEEDRTIAIKEYEECYIAFLDILGFKALVKEKNCSYISEIMEKVNWGKVPIWAAGKNVEKGRVDIHVKIISDSICLYVDSSSEQNLQRLLFCCQSFQQDLLDCETPIFVRGGIAKGNIYADGDVIFGPGLIEAYQMEEFNAKYPRVIITNSLLLTFRDPSSKNFIRNLEDIAFRDFDGFYTLNYFRDLVCNRSNGVLIKKVKRYINSTLDVTIDNSLREKYNYVLNNILKEEQLANIIE